MGNTSSQKQRKIKNVLPQTEEEKKEMKKPHIVKPCPEMYPFNHIECGSKSERSTSIVPAGCPRVSLSVTGHTRGPSSPQSSLPQRSHSTFCACVKEARTARFATMSTRSISVSSFDFSLLHIHPNIIITSFSVQKKGKVYSRQF